MEKVTLHIDGREIIAEKGTRLLWVALDSGISIPHLCARKDREPPFGACRLCYVAIEGRREPVTSCTVEVWDGLIARTRTPEVDRLIASGFEMLMSHHNLECRKCLANHHCELQKIAVERKLKLKPKRVPRIEKFLPLDDSHPAILMDRSKCVLCGQCLWVCHREGGGVLDFARRGLETKISTFADLPLGSSDCPSGCQACAVACPTGALSLKSR